jgi:hypothetical protein
MKDIDRIELELPLGNDFKSRALRIISKTLCFLLAVPLFINLKNFSFFIHNVKLNSYFQDGIDGIPFPFFGFMALLLLVLTAAFYLKNIIKTLEKMDYILLAFLFLFILAGLASSYKLTSLIQLLLLPILLWLTSFFRIDDRLKKYFIGGLLAFSFLHLLSFFILNDFSFTKMALRHAVYEVIFHYQIYQCLISYVNVLTLGGLFVIYRLFQQTELKKSIFLGFSFILLMYLASLSVQRLVALDFIVITFVIFVLIISKKTKFYNKIISLSSLIISWLLSIFFVNSSAGSSMTSRLFQTISRLNNLSMTGNLSNGTGNLSNGLERISNLRKVIEELSVIYNEKGIVGLFFGQGIVHSGAHNFIIDMLYGAGIIGALFFFAFLFTSFAKFVRPVFTKKTSYQALFIIGLFLMAGFGAMVNSPLTQPLYFLPLLFIAWSIVSDSKNMAVSLNS